MAAAVATLRGPLGGLDAVSVDPNRSVREPMIAPAVVPHPGPPSTGCAENDHEDRFAPALRFRQSDAETLEDLKRRASFSKEDRGLLRDWMAVAAARAAAASRAKS